MYSRWEELWSCSPIPAPLLLDQISRYHSLWRPSLTGALRPCQSSPSQSFPVYDWEEAKSPFSCSCHPLWDSAVSVCHWGCALLRLQPLMYLQCSLCQNCGQASQGGRVHWDGKWIALCGRREHRSICRKSHFSCILAWEKTHLSWESRDPGFSVTLLLSVWPWGVFPVLWHSVSLTRKKKFFFN